MTIFPNMRRSIISALALASLAAAPVTASEPATEPSSECRSIAALTSGRASDLAQISLHFRLDGKIDLRTNGSTDNLTGADECELVGPVEQIIVYCKWEFDTAAEARAALTQMSDRIVTCTPQGFTRTENDYATKSYIVHLADEAEFELDEGAGLSLRIEMIEFIHKEISHFSVSFEVES